MSNLPSVAHAQQQQPGRQPMKTVLTLDQAQFSNYSNGDEMSHNQEMHLPNVDVTYQ